MDHSTMREIRGPVKKSAEWQTD